MATRTKLQQDADRLDLQVFRAVGALEQFASQYHFKDIDAMAGTINGLRYLVRKHMHPKDREETS